MLKSALVGGMLSIAAVLSTLLLPAQQTVFDVVVIDSRGDDVGEDVSMVLLDDAPAMTYYDFANGDLKYARCDDVTCSLVTIQTIDADGDVGLDPTLAIIDGLPAISYFDYTNADLKYAACQDVLCNDFNVRVVDENGSVGRYSSVVEINGLPSISYYDDTDPSAGMLKYARCNNLLCSSADITVVDPGPSAGRDTSIANVNGLPAISYFYDRGDDLYYARCTDLNCTNATIEPVDDNKSVGMYSSLAMVVGQPAMSYFGNPRGTLKYLRCTDENCTSFVRTNVFTESHAGWYTSLAMFGEAPGITFFDTDEESVYFARCYNPNCTEGAAILVDDEGVVGLGTSVVAISETQGAVAYYAPVAGELRYRQFAVPPIPPIESADGDDEGGEFTVVNLESSLFEQVTSLPATGEFSRVQRGLIAGMALALVVVACGLPVVWWVRRR